MDCLLLLLLALLAALSFSVRHSPSLPQRHAIVFQTAPPRATLNSNAAPCHSDFQLAIGRRRSLYSMTAVTRLSHFSGCGICGNSSVAHIGDTLSSVAQYCSVELDLLIAANPQLIDADITGMTLSIPCQEDPANCTVCGSSHRVQQGDTLLKIADDCQIDLHALENANPGIDYDNLVVDQYITLPCGDSKNHRSLQGCGPCGIEYSTTTNQTVQGIASLCEVREEELRAANPSLQKSEGILQGQVVNVPCNGNFSMNCGLCGLNYTVQKTDKLTVIALKCRVGTIDLQLLNPGIVINSAIAGHVLHVPCQSTKETTNPVCSSCSPSVQVLPDETHLADIASRCNISIDLLSFANSIPSLRPIKEGQVLFVPCAKVGRPEQNCSICGSSIELNALVDFDKVVNSCGLNGSQLEGINPKVDLGILAPGDKLNLPCNNPKPNCGPCGIAYLVQENDDLQSVAVKCARAAADIQYLNQNNRFLEGSILTMPCFPQGATSDAVHLKLVSFQGPFHFVASSLCGPLSLITFGHFLIVSMLTNWRTSHTFTDH